MNRMIIGFFAVNSILAIATVINVWTSSNCQVYLTEWILCDSLLSVFSVVNIKLDDFLNREYEKNLAEHIV